jgi:hypothetical protein
LRLMQSASFTRDASPAQHAASFCETTTTKSADRSTAIDTRKVLQTHQEITWDLAATNPAWRSAAHDL